MGVYNVRVWTGPTIVKQMARKFREAGFNVFLEGTEHIYISGVQLDSSAPMINPYGQIDDTYRVIFLIQEKLRENCGTTFGFTWRDMRVTNGD